LELDTDTQLAYSTAWIRAYCGWHIAPSIIDAATLDTFGGRTLRLPTLHLTDVAYVTYTADDSVVDPDDLSWSTVGLVERSCGCWPRGLGTVTVEFTHGFDTVPEVLRALTVQMATRLPAQFASVTSETAGGVTRQYGGLLSGQAAVANYMTASEKIILDMHYRLWPAP